MRFVITGCLLFIFLFSGCAFEGTVVRKEFRPLPFIDSLGLEGFYKFELRDKSGQIHRQMVTSYVFASYEVGDYFNDLQALPSDSAFPGPAPVMPGPFRQTPELYQIPYQPVRTTSAPTVAPSLASSKKVAAVKRHHTRIATNAKHKKSRKKIARARRSRPENES